MTVYRFSGRTKQGAMKKGIIEAGSKQLAIKKLRDQGVNPRQIEESKNILHKDFTIGKVIKNEDFVIYCRQFATLIRAGISIVEATHILSEQTTSKGLKKALNGVEEDLRSGIAFSDAATKFPKIFPVLFVNMMKAGEATGNLDETLDRMAFSYEKSFKLKKKIQSTMIYPIVLAVLIICVSAFLLIWLVPQFTANFQSFGAKLPTITLMVLAFSHALKKFWWIFLLILFGVVSGFAFFYKNNEKFNFYTHYALLKMPVFGKVLQKSAIARMTRTLSTLFSSAVPILNALAIIEKIIGDPVIENVIKRSKASLEKGSSLAEPLEASWVFPPLVTQMVSIGEQTGSLDYMLQKIAEFYEDDVDRTVDSLKALIEPIMILLLAGVVGFIMVAIMLPMFSLYQQI